MIKIDALYFLLLIELLLVISGASALLLFRWKKYSAFYRNSIKDLTNALQDQEKLQKQPGEIQPNPPQQATAEGDAGAGGEAAIAPGKAVQEHENRKIEVTVLEEKLKEKNRLLNELQVKFDELEKEYLILYRQQQQQQQGDAAKP